MDKTFKVKNFALRKRKITKICYANTTPTKSAIKLKVLKSCVFADLNSIRNGKIYTEKKKMYYEVKKKCFTKYMLISRGLISDFITDKDFLICLVSENDQVSASLVWGIYPLPVGFYVCICEYLCSGCVFLAVMKVVLLKSPQSCRT